MNKLQIAVLASGSGGNSVAVFPGTGPGFLLDCGLSKKVLKKRLELIGKTLADIQGVFITHAHKDHFHDITCKYFEWVRSIYSFAKYSLEEPVLGGTVTPLKLSHGNCLCHGFRFDYQGMSIAYLVDTEYVPEESLKYLFDLDAIVIEANYREEMVKGRAHTHGDPTARHLSNEQAACTLGLINSKRLKHVIMAHVSGRSNYWEFAWNAGKAGAPQAQVLVAEQDRPTRMITLMSEKS